MTAPRLAVDLGAIEHNTRMLVERLAPRGIRVTGVTKAALGSPGVARAMVRGGALGLGDSRVENLARLDAAGLDVPRTLIRSPMVSQAAAVVRHADTSLNSEPAVLDALSVAAMREKTIHRVVLMVELGDLREGVLAEDLLDLARSVASRPGLTLAGIGTNLACQNGVVPDQAKMAELSGLADQVETATGTALSIVSGGNSANLGWALSTSDVGRVDELRLGEAIMLGVDPLHRTPIGGLSLDAFALVAELIEVKAKPALPWGTRAQAAFGTAPEHRGGGTVRQGIVALGRQDTDPDGLRPPDDITVLGMSSDHLVVDLGDHAAQVGDELTFGVDYSALLRAATSPFVTVVESEPGRRAREPRSQAATAGR